MHFDGLNWESIEKQIKSYGKKPPFDYVVIDDFFTKDFAKKLSKEFPAYSGVREAEDDEVVITTFGRDPYNKLKARTTWKYTPDSYAPHKKRMLGSASVLSGSYSQHKTSALQYSNNTVFSQQKEHATTAPTSSKNSSLSKVGMSVDL